MTCRLESAQVVNALTIDVEDYFQVSALASSVRREHWSSIECRIERNMNLLLDLMDQAGVKATFFTLGWIAERYPGLVRRLVADGHELASHGYGHLRASDQERSAFTDDVLVAKKILEDISGVSVRGYRAPSFSIGAENLWAFECLLEAGYEYSSSIYPIQHDHYGMPAAPRCAFDVGNGLFEIPISTVAMLGRNWPVGGGGYFRLLPYVVSRSAIARLNNTERRSAIFYLHPWELDPQQPQVRGLSLRSRFRHYINLDKTEGRLMRLMRDFNWGRVDRVFLDVLQSKQTSPVLP